MRKLRFYARCLIIFIEELTWNEIYLPDANNSFSDRKLELYGRDAGHGEAMRIGEERGLVDAHWN